MRRALLLVWLLCGAARADVAPILQHPPRYSDAAYRYMRIERADGTVVCIRMNQRDWHIEPGKDGWQPERVEYDGIRIVDDVCEPPTKRSA